MMEELPEFYRMQTTIGTVNSIQDRFGMDLLKSVGYPHEVVALLRYQFGGSKTTMTKYDLDSMSPTMRQCFYILNRTSRSFGGAIGELGAELRNAVCIFYLVLRALDTVEDDMTIPNDIKVPMLKSFYKNLLDPDWQYNESCDKDKTVLENFPSISKELRNLSEMYRGIISDICQKMGEGMTVFLDSKIDTVNEWDEYCHYVSGLVGIGLVKLFAASGLEAKKSEQDLELANTVGLFLQRTHVIRDYYEDLRNDRIFWPKSIWGKYGSNIGDFAEPHNRENALACLNELITYTLELLPSSCLYLSRVRSPTIFRFVSFIQIKHLANLERCYNNPKVFSGVVNIRTGEAARFMMEAISADSVKAVMRHYTIKILKKIPNSDPSAAKTRAVCQKALEVTETQQEYSTLTIYPPLYVSMGLMLIAITYMYWY